MARVYLSSTFEDLKEHRRAIYDALRQLRHDVVAMEDYTAAGASPLEKCLADVASSDVCVGIVAWRRGHVPEGQDKSITELEIGHARQLGKPTLVFLLEEDQPWPPSQVDADRTAITAFREQLRNGHTVQQFRTPRDLATAVAVSVTNVFAESAPPVPDVPEEDDASRRFYLRCVDRMADELARQMQLYRVSTTVIAVSATSVGFAGAALGWSTLGLGALLMGTAAIYPLSTLHSTRRKKVLLDALIEGLNEVPPAVSALQQVRQFVHRQMEKVSLT
ncbi:MAG: DUF4062 domain-containing protein [Myxococcota bacterium]